METIKKLIDWLLPKPTWVKMLSCLLVFLVSIIVLFSCTSCGTTRAFAKTNDLGTTTITITTNNPTSVNASPNIDVKLNPDK